MKVISTIDDNPQDFEVEVSSQDRGSLRIGSEQKLVRNIFYFLIISLPICFGAVHEKIYYPTLAILFVITAWIFYKEASSLLSSQKNFQFYTSIARGLIWSLLLASFAQRLLFYFLTSEHSVLGSVSRNGSSFSFYTQILGFLFALATFEVTSYLLRAGSRISRKITSALVISGSIVSLIALSHWFYDNGKLFWIFEPNALFVSNRARWPFVNANSLAHFLLIPIFLSLSKVLTSYYKIFEDKNLNVAENSNSVRRKNSFAAFTPRIQKNFAIGFVNFCAFLSMTLALLGSLSRGAFFGFIAGLVVLTFLYLKNKPKKAKLFIAPTVRDSRRKLRSRKREDLSIFFNKAKTTLVNWLPIIFVSSILFLLLLFIYGEAGERIEGRIEYSLINTIEDTRWQLYNDSIEMLTDNFYLGAGVGNWASLYPEYMNPKLSGINPVYLHSDPFQLLIELGMIFGFVFFGLAFYFLSKAAYTILKTKAGSNFISMALFSGLISLIVASLFDFPFRIPAISFVFLITVATLCYKLDLRNKMEHSTSA